MLNDDLDPEKRQQLLETAAMQGQTTINGLVLRPMNWTTYSLFYRIKDLAGSPNEWSFNLMLFVFLHSAPETTLRANFANPDKLVPEVFDFMNARNPGDMKAFEPWVESQVSQFAASTTSSDPSFKESLGDPKS